MEQNFDPEKDYYAALGVLPTSEDVVIRAAYRALAQRYHPDRSPSARDEANRRMAEINEAFAVLSDAKRRADYDSSRGDEKQSADEYFDEADSQDNFADPMVDDWRVAVEFFPDLEQLCSALLRISSRLEFTFRAVLLESKAFDKREQFAKAMEHEFLQLYFGEDPQILQFARTLIERGNRPAAKALNRAVRVLGGSLPATQVISKIAKDYLLGDAKASRPCTAAEAARFLSHIRMRQVGDVEVMLCQMPSLVDTRNSDGESGLHVAVREGSLALVQLLLCYGIEHKARNAQGETALDVAERIGFGRKSIAEALRQLC